MDRRSRILAIGPVSEVIPPGPDVIRVDSLDAAREAILQGAYEAIYIDPTYGKNCLEQFARYETILTFAERGIAFLSEGNKVAWANPVLRQWCGCDPVSQPLLSVLTSTAAAVKSSDPFAQAWQGETTNFRVHRPDHFKQQYLDITVHPVRSSEGKVTQLLALCRNTTAEVEQQKKLDALHRAGQELATLHAADLTDMTLSDRVELLRHNLRRYVHDLLHYDVIEVRLLDRQTGELKPLLEEGMTQEASARVLYARATGNGVTGYVAHTGKSYLCPDAANDPHYITGAAGARSSMTVPLIYDEQVVGTLNVESPRIDGFGPEDLQFTELFSREVAAALHTLDLLSAQQNCSVLASIEAVHREIALPVDDILASAELLILRGESDGESLNHLRRIIDRVRSIKENVCKVARDMGNSTSTVGPLATLTDPPLTGKHVLVLDPDERMRRQAHLVLGRLGATVETASTSAEVLAMAAGHQYDAIIMDIRPPDLGGYETYRRLRDTRPESQVAMATGFGYDSGHAIVKARQDGMQFVLFKPYRPDQLIRAVLSPPLPRGTCAAATPVGGTT